MALGIGSSVAQLGGGLSDTERAVLYGSASYTVPPYGSLRWTGPTYNPAANSFTRLRVTGDGRLEASVSRNGAAVATSDANCYLYAPVSGLYWVSATQAWLTDTIARGAGLGTSSSSGTTGIVLWQDIGLGRFVNTSKLVYLAAGTRLYPWTWSAASSQMTGSDRGLSSQYQILYAGQG